jgi:hypothetical protein
MANKITVVRDDTVENRQYHDFSFGIIGRESNIGMMPIKQFVESLFNGNALGFVLLNQTRLVSVWLVNSITVEAIAEYERGLEDNE